MKTHTPTVGKKRKIKELTPPHLQSFPFGCPAMFKRDDHTYLIIGKVVAPGECGLEERVMDGEVLIEVSVDLVRGSIDRDI